MPKLLISIRYSKKDEILQFCVICLFAHSVRVTVRAVQCRVTDIVTAPYATYAILRGSFFFTHTRNVYLYKAIPSKMQKNLMTRHFQTMVITRIMEPSQPYSDFLDGAAVLTGFIEPFVVNILVEGRGKRGNPLPGENAGSRSPGNLCRS